MLCTNGSIEILWRRGIYLVIESISHVNAHRVYVFQVVIAPTDHLTMFKWSILGIRTSGHYFKYGPLLFMCIKLDKAFEPWSVCEIKPLLPRLRLGNQALFHRLTRFSGFIYYIVYCCQIQWKLKIKCFDSCLRMASS